MLVQIAKEMQEAIDSELSRNRCKWETRRVDCFDFLFLTMKSAREDWLSRGIGVGAIESSVLLRLLIAGYFTPPSVPPLQVLVERRPIRQLVLVLGLLSCPRASAGARFTHLCRPGPCRGKGCWARPELCLPHRHAHLHCHLC